jgi:CheY-like chemotaxis protein/HPt (histidine-containing phosphotransfer) domain-containing protein
MVFQFGNRDRAIVDPALPLPILVAALDGVREAVVICDAQGQVRWCNRAFGQQCRRDRPALVGVAVDDLLHCVNDQGQPLGTGPLWAAVRSRSTGTGRVHPTWTQPAAPWIMTWTRPLASAGLVVLHLWIGGGRIPCPREQAGVPLPRQRQGSEDGRDRLGNAPPHNPDGATGLTRHPEPSALRSAPEAAIYPPSGLGLPLRVLLAEDNRVNQQVARLMLKRLGYEATVVDDGLAALQAVERDHYDLILMDVEMPRMDGLTAARTIVQQRFRPRAAQGAPKTQGGRSPHHSPDQAPHQSPYIVALTAYAMPGDRDRCLEAGMDDYITKPLREETLMAVLARAAQRATVTVTVLPADPPLSPSPLPPSPMAPPPMPVPQGPPIAGGMGGFAAAIADLDQHPVLDAAVMGDLKRMAGQRAAALLATIAQQYGEDSPKRLDEVTIAIAHRDSDRLRKAAHSLRSSSANLGALRLAALAEVVENHARQGKTSEIDDLLPKLREEYEKVMERLPLAIEE